MRVANHNPARRRGAAAAGFTLIEILMTMFILGIGLTSIVAVFYGAVRLQQRSTGEVEAAGFARSAEQMLKARGIREALLVDGTMSGLLTQYVTNDSWDNGGNFVVPMPPLLAPPPDFVALNRYDPTDAPDVISAEDQWRLNDRVHPQGLFFDAQALSDEIIATNSRLAQYERARYLWVGFIQDRNPVDGLHDWRVFLFILRTDRADYTVADANVTNNWISANPFDGSTDTPSDLNAFNDPQGRRLPHVVGIPAAPNSLPNATPSIINAAEHHFHIHAGDTVLLSNGVIARVVDVLPNTIELDIPHQMLGNGQLWFSPSPTPNTESATVMITTLPSGVIR